MGGLLSALLEISLSAGVLMLVVFAVRLLLCKAPKTLHCALWALVAVRLIFPFSIESVCSLLPRTDEIVQDVVSLQSSFSSAEIVSTAEAAAPHDTMGVSQTVGGVVLAVWITGIAVMLLYAAISYFRLYKRLRTAMLLENRVWICDGLHAPFIFGVIRPRIYIPSDLSEVQMQHVLRHENAHIERCDHWWKPLSFLLLAIYWFHPLVWISYILFCRDMELACDARAVRTMDLAEKKAYSETLLVCSIYGHKSFIQPLAFAEIGVKARVKSVLHYKKPSVLAVPAMIVICAAVAICFMTSPKSVPTALPQNAVSGETVEPNGVQAAEAVPVTEPSAEAATEPATEPAAENQPAAPVSKSSANKKSSGSSKQKTGTTSGEGKKSSKSVVQPISPPEYDPVTMPPYTGPAFTPPANNSYITTSSEKITIFSESPTPPRDVNGR